MAITVEAVYEDGVLKLAGPLPLAEHEAVRVTVEPCETWAQRTAGLLRWNGSVEELDHFIQDPELDPYVGP